MTELEKALSGKAFDRRVEDIRAFQRIGPKARQKKMQAERDYRLPLQKKELLLQMSTSMLQEKEISKYQL